MRIRKLKKYGNTWVITLAIVDVNDFNLQEGDLFDVETLLLTGGVKKSKKVKQDESKPTMS